MMPTVSVLISTRDRPQQILECLRSVLATDDDDFEVVVVDQSVTPLPEVQSGALLADTRVRWITSQTTGLSTSRNIALAAARAPVVAFTDDDCRVESGWVASIRHAFQADGELAILFGTVSLPAEDRADGYAAEFEPGSRAEYRGSFPDIREQWGIGANMALRRTVADHVGNFDEMLGAGAPFRAGEEIDFTIRALDKGYKVVHSDETSVHHLGLRRGFAARQLIRNYGIGMGAALCKHVRLRTPGATGLWLGLVWHHSRRSAINVLRRRANPGFGLVAAIIVGTGRSLTRRLDRSKEVFRTPDRGTQGSRR
jgi:glycosyltransferase involved in cell wall biosynthesis